MKSELWFNCKNGNYNLGEASFREKLSIGKIIPKVQQKQQLQSKSC